MDQPHMRLLKPFGVFYFFENFIVAEINEGEHFSYLKAKEIIDSCYKYYGNNPKIAYVSNRVNSYSLELTLYSKMKRDGHQLIVASAVIIYDQIGLKIATLEKSFSKHSLKRCYTLDEAIVWVSSLREFSISNT
jgi:hypothetical protein